MTVSGPWATHLGGVATGPQNKNAGRTWEGLDAATAGRGRGAASPWGRSQARHRRLWRESNARQRRHTAMAVAASSCGPFDGGAVAGFGGNKGERGTRCFIVGFSSRREGCVPGFDQCQHAWARVFVFPCSLARPARTWHGRRESWAVAEVASELTRKRMTDSRAVSPNTSIAFTRASKKVGKVERRPLLHVKFIQQGKAKNGSVPRTLTNEPPRRCPCTGTAVGLPSATERRWAMIAGVNRLPCSASPTYCASRGT